MNHFKLILLTLSFLSFAYIEVHHQNTQNFLTKWRIYLEENDCFIPQKYCNTENIDNSKDGCIELGFPEEIKEYQGHLNDDNTLDILYTFYPKQCDSGRATQYFQYALILLSSDNGFIEIHEYPSLSLGIDNFYHFKGIHEGKIKADFYQYQEDSTTEIYSIDEVYLSLQDNKVVYPTK